MANPKPKSLPSQEFLRSILDYDPITGLFTWKYRQDICQSANIRFAGKLAGNLTPKGYRSISINGTRYRAHRLAWVYVHGKEPAHLIDHANGIPSDNRLSLIRPATVSQNQQNKRGKLGRLLPKGVKPNHNRYMARIRLHNQEIYLGTFDTPEEAHQAYSQASIELFGEFARAS